MKYLSLSENGGQWVQDEKQVIFNPQLPETTENTPFYYDRSGRGEGMDVSSCEIFLSERICFLSNPQSHLLSPCLELATWWHN
jgi:hypothetical protein